MCKQLYQRAIVLNRCSNRNDTPAKTGAQTRVRMHLTCVLDTGLRRHDGFCKPGSQGMCRTVLGVGGLALTALALMLLAPGSAIAGGDNPADAAAPGWETEIAAAPGEPPPEPTPSEKVEEFIEDSGSDFMRWVSEAHLFGNYRWRRWNGRRW